MAPRILHKEIGKTPLFDGICAQCGALLYGASRPKDLGNVCYGPPLNRDGQPVRQDLEVDAQAQPPFLLRFSSQLLATEAPDMFSWDAKTNRLSLREGKKPPWIRTFADAERARRNTDNCWLYCPDCKARYCPDARVRQSKQHVPYRDKASQVLFFLVCASWVCT